jgi:hypothetical protein
MDGFNFAIGSWKCCAKENNLGCIICIHCLFSPQGYTHVWIEEDEMFVCIFQGI